MMGAEGGRVYTHFQDSTELCIALIIMMMIVMPIALNDASINTKFRLFLSFIPSSLLPYSPSSPSVMEVGDDIFSRTEPFFKVHPIGCGNAYFLCEPEQLASIPLDSTD